MRSSQPVLPYASVGASAVLGFVGLVVIGNISILIREWMVAQRPATALPAATAFLFTHALTIRSSSFVVALLILVVGVVSVRRASTSDQATRRALRLSICAALFTSIALLAGLICLLMPFAGVVIKGVDTNVTRPGRCSRAC